MANISEVIEQFIIASLGDNDSVDISRNSLAEYFSCAPSQINYVLSTRFTNPRGFIIESRRGGGGYIKLTKVDLDKNDYLNELIVNAIQDDISFSDAVQLINGLRERNFLTNREYDIIISVISNKSLSNPLKIEDKLRANILKGILVNIIKGE